MNSQKIMKKMSKQRKKKNLRRKYFAPSVRDLVLNQMMTFESILKVIGTLKMQGDAQMYLLTNYIIKKNQNQASLTAEEYTDSLLIKAEEERKNTKVKEKKEKKKGKKNNKKNEDNEEDAVNANDNEKNDD